MVSFDTKLLSKITLTFNILTFNAIYFTGHGDSWDGFLFLFLTFFCMNPPFHGFILVLILCLLGSSFFLKFKAKLNSAIYFLGSQICLCLIILYYYLTDIGCFTSTLS